MKLLKLIIALILKFLLRPKKEDLQHELDKIEEQIAKKRQSMEDAKMAGFSGHYHALYNEWRVLCAKKNRLCKRLIRVQGD